MRSTLHVEDIGGRLRPTLVHNFRKRDGFPAYEVYFGLGDASPLAPALDYRQWLQARGTFVTLQQKIARNPEVGKLLGSTHA